MATGKAIKIKSTKIVKHNGKNVLVKRKDIGSKNLINYIEDSSNMVKFENLSEEEKNKIYEQYKQEKNVDFENLESINNLINYVSNNNKCFYDKDNSLLIDAINCDNKFNAAKEFEALEQEYHKHKIENLGYKTVINDKGEKEKVPKQANEAFHIIQSFKGKDVNPDKIHEIGMEMARRLCGDNYKAVISTHLNTDNYHNHIAICAYNIDTYHKFLDEWNFGFKLQNLNDELSLENGLEIITKFSNDKLEEDENIFDDNSINEKTHFTNIGEFKSETLAKKRLMSDILLTAKESFNFDEYEKKMNEKGYTLIKQAKSIKYIKNTIIPSIKSSKKHINEMRDTRLGKQFTRASLEHYFNQKAKNLIIEEIQAPEKVKILVYKLKPKKFLGTKGSIQRVPLIFQILDFILNLLQALLLGNENYYKVLPNKSEALVKSKMEIEKQIKDTGKAILKAKDLLKKHNIQNLNSLLIKKKFILRLYRQHLNQNKNRFYAIKEYNKIEKAILIYNELKDQVKSLNLTNDELKLDILGEANILENKAKIEPMYPQTKSRLYKALYNSNLKLKYKFSQLTESEAKEIIYYITELNKGNNPDKPEYVYDIKEYMKLKSSGLLKEPQYNDYINLKQYQPDLSKYNDNDKELIKKYRSSLLLLKSYGLDTDDKINDFLAKIKIDKAKYDDLENVIYEEKSYLKDYNLIEDFFTGKLKDKFKPLDLFEDTDAIEEQLNKYVNENESLKEQLITLKTLLNDPYIKPQLALLDNDNIIIAPAEVLSICKIILACKGRDIDDKTLINMDKKQIKEIINDFIENYDIDAYLKQELNTELNIEKGRINKELKDTIINKEILHKDQKEETLNKVDKKKYEEILMSSKIDEELTKQTEKEQEETVDKIIKSFSK